MHLQSVSSALERYSGTRRERTSQARSLARSNLLLFLLSVRVTTSDEWRQVVVADADFYLLLQASSSALDHGHGYHNQSDHSQSFLLPADGAATRLELKLNEYNAITGQEQRYHQSDPELESQWLETPTLARLICLGVDDEPLLAAPICRQVSNLNGKLARLRAYLGKARNWITKLNSYDESYLWARS